MMTPITNNSSAHSVVYRGADPEQGRTPLLKAAAALLGVSLFGLLFTLTGGEYLPFEVERPYLVIWVLGTGAVIIAPILYLRRRGEFSVVHPLVYAGGTYFFPVFFLGGWSLVFGLSNYYYLAFINDPEYDLPLAFLYVILGFGSLAFGFLVKPGRLIGQRLSRWLPSGDLSYSELFVGSLVFLIVGIYVTIVALDLGQIGYQTRGTIFGDAGSLNVYLTVIVPTSSFLLWIVFFRSRGWSVNNLVIVAAQICAALFMLIVLGGKSSLIQSLTYMAAAFVLVKRKLVFRDWVWITGGLAAALVVGFLYGTTFRSIKGSDERISVERYVDISLDTISRIGDMDPSAGISESFYQFAERIEIGSSLAVVVSNYEALAQYEAAYGLENNIWLYTWTAFVPRFLWKDKPIIADNYSYNELYFGYGGFGLAITSMGDLLRNFGPVGVPIGMFVLGFAMRIFYSTLMEGQPFSAWRSVVYVLVLTKISYDSFYGDILPTTIRVAAVVIAQLLLIKFLFKFLPVRR